MKKEDLLNKKWKFGVDYLQRSFIIKEDTNTETPVGMLPWPLGKHVNGTQRQRMNAELVAKAPELYKTCINLLYYITVCNDTKTPINLQDSELKAAHELLSELSNRIEKIEEYTSYEDMIK